MKKSFSLVTVVCSALSANGAEFKFPTQTFTVPDGFEVELAAGTNVLRRPVSASFDDRGRLYVTDSSGSNDKPAEQLKNPTARLLRLEDTDGSGRFNKSIVFADRVMFPQGCLWHDGWVYVASPPSIWRFRDKDGDGMAEQREEWWKGNTLTSCANDVHGPYLGPDNYLYWTKGAFAEQTHKLGNGRMLNDQAAHIYRARADGSDLDVVMSGGMDNPVEVAFTPEGEAIFTSTFIDLSQPGRRDGIGHAVYGGVFGKIHDVIEDRRVKRARPEVMHPFYEAGPAAECGLCRYESDVFGAGFATTSSPRASICTRSPGTSSGWTVRPTRAPTAIFWCRTVWISIRLMCCRMLTEACSWWTRAAGTSFAAPVRNSPSRMCQAGFTGSDGRARHGSPAKSGRPRTPDWSGHQVSKTKRMRVPPL